ncbi:uncharacterized protein LOC122507655 [Leptopilina heterotoma]|uniref:uncharacterized protein LOC122507655 n=1 Tax=Leptopilina heterotoma TaxID=63436 RepID=UPI001CA9E52C|nr:uncharacterized protein LOC122507655 [Leptopilina heterotoma]
MSDKRITRQGAKDDPKLSEEIEQFNPFGRSQIVSRSPTSIVKPLLDLSIDSDIYDETTIEHIPKTDTPLNTNIQLYTSTPKPTILDYSNDTDDNTIISLDSENLNQVLLGNNFLNPNLNNLEPNINLNNVELQPVNMALQLNQTVSLTDALKAVPEFDGTNISVNEFIRGCLEAKAMVGEAAEENLTRLIRTKVYGEARKAISGQTFGNTEEFSNFLRDIYATTKTVKQLYGELGNEFQKENENVLTFANRIRDIGTRILDAQRIMTNAVVTEAFKTETQNDIIECFKEGLLPEIEQKMTNQANINNLIREAIRVEKKILAQREKRLGSSETKNQKRREIFQAEEHNPPQPMNTNFENATVFCQVCNRKGHSALQCYKIKTCPICNKSGHDAKFCRANGPEKCQICDKLGHNARTCYQNPLYKRPNEQNPNNKQIESRTQFKCQICNRIGHTAASCRSLPKNSDNECKFCHKQGHQIEECRSRIYQNRLRDQGNDQSPHRQGVNQGTFQNQNRSVNVTETQDLASELIP